MERLCLDSTSFREIREHSGDDPSAMADRIMEIVRERGKMHNPETDSGASCSAPWRGSASSVRTRRRRAGGF